jgi:glycosyltransferase involved in cell wall biosynthesis
MARGDAVIADSALTAETIGRLFPAAKGRIHIVVGGVDSRLFAPNAVAPARVQAVRRMWGAAQDERAVYAAAGSRISGAAKTVIEAVQLLSRDPGADAVLAGTKFIVACDEAGGAFAREIDATIAKAGLQNLVRTCAAIADRAAALLASSVVVALSTQGDSLAGPALEAQAMGVPVIVPDAGAASETILAPPEVDDAARTGWRTPLDAAAVADALRAALSLGATARDRLSLQGRAHVEARFSIAQTWAQTLAAYVAARGDPR